MIFLYYLDCVWLKEESYTPGSRVSELWYDFHFNQQRAATDYKYTYKSDCQLNI